MESKSIITTNCIYGVNHARLLDKVLYEVGIGEDSSEIISHFSKVIFPPVHNMMGMHKQVTILII
jgi:hypothetical protein